MTKFYIYRTNHIQGRQPLSVEWSDTAANAVARFEERGEAAGTFVAETKCRKVFWWLY